MCEQQKKKIDKFDNIKIKSFCFKRHCQKWKENPQNWRKYLQIIYLMRALYLEYINTSFNNVKKTQFKKWAKASFPRKILKWPVSTWKETQHYLSLGKYKSKPQWDTTSHLVGWLFFKKENKCWWRCGKIGKLVHC